LSVAHFASLLTKLNGFEKNSFIFNGAHNSSVSFMKAGVNASFTANYKVAGAILLRGAILKQVAG
jgi:hypothetical protein